MRIIAAVVSMLSTIFVAVPALSRVEPAMTSGPTAGAIVRSTNVCSSVRGSQVTKMIFAPGLARARQRAAHELRHAAGRHADDDVLLGRPQPADRARAFLVVVLDAFLARAKIGVLAAGHDRLHEVGIGAEGRRHLRRLEHAEPAARAGADEHDAAALPQRLGDDLDADARCAPSRAGPRRRILRSSVSISSTMSAAAACRCERGGIDGFGGKGLPLRADGHAIGSATLLSAHERATHGDHYGTSASMRVRPMRAGRASTRISTTCASSGGWRRHTLESYARDLARWRAFAAGVERRRRGARSPGDLEAFVRDLMGAGLSPRSVARAGRLRRAASTGSSSSTGASSRQPGRRSAGRRAPGRRCRKFLSIEEVDRAARAARRLDAARPARPRADRSALRDRAARHRSSSALRARRREPRRRVPDVHREGQQGADRADRRRSGGAGCRATMREARPALLGRRSVAAPVRQRARRRER